MIEIVKGCMYSVAMQNFSFSDEAIKKVDDIFKRLEL